MATTTSAASGIGRAQSRRSFTFRSFSSARQSASRRKRRHSPSPTIEEIAGGGVPFGDADRHPATISSRHTRRSGRLSEKGLRESSAKMIPANRSLSRLADHRRIAINRVPIARIGIQRASSSKTRHESCQSIYARAHQAVSTMQSMGDGGAFAQISTSKFCETPNPPAAAGGAEGDRGGDRGLPESHQRRPRRPRPLPPPHPHPPRLADGAISASLAENLDSRRVPITKGDRKEGPFPVLRRVGNRRSRRRLHLSTKTSFSSPKMARTCWLGRQPYRVLSLRKVLGATITRTF